MEMKSPNGWIVSNFSDVAEARMGKTILSKELMDEGLPVFSAATENEVWGYIADDSIFFEHGTIVISARGTIGAVKIPRFERFISTQTTIAASPRNGVDSNFLTYQLTGVDWTEYTSTTAIPMLTISALSRLPIRIAPLNEQHRIVEKIETLFARLDKGEETLREVQKLLARYRQSVLKAAVTGQLTADWRIANPVPDWQEIVLGDVTEFLTSGSRGWAKYYAPSGALFIRAQNLKYDRLDLDDVAFVNLPQKSEGIRTLVQRGDLLITITGANVTKTALVDVDIKEAYVSQHVGLLRLKGSADPKFIYWFLIAKAGGRKQLEEVAYGAGKPGLNLANIRDVRLALPTIHEQWEIVSRLQDELDRFEIIEDFCKSELTRSAALRQSILKDAFAGRLVPQDPNDEPASELLARIRAERAREPKKRKIPKTTGA